MLFFVLFTRACWTGLRFEQLLSGCDPRLKYALEPSMKFYGILTPLITMNEPATLVLIDLFLQRLAAAKMNPSIITTVEKS
jgi:hypothetical protein